MLFILQDHFSNFTYITWSISIINPNNKNLMYYFLKLYKSPSFDRFIDLEQVENWVVLVLVTKLFFFH